MSSGLHEYNNLIEFLVPSIKNQHRTPLENASPDHHQAYAHPQIALCEISKEFEKLMQLMPKNLKRKAPYKTKQNGQKHLEQKNIKSSLEFEPNLPKTKWGKMT